MGRFVFIAVSQPAPKPPAIDEGPVMLMKAVTVAPSQVVRGKVLGPVTIGEGVDVDTARLPTIFDVQVLTVSAGEEFDPQTLEEGARVIPFAR